MSQTFNKKNFDLMIKGVHYFLKWAVVGLVGLTAILLVGAIGVMFIPKELLDFDLANLENVNVQVMNIMYALEELNFTGIVNVKWLIVFGMTIGAVNLFFLVYVLHMMKGVVKDVKGKAPFSDDNIKRLKYMGYAYLISAVALPLINNSLAVYVVNLLDLWEADVNFMINFSAVFMGAIILILAGVFEYGETLQEDHDLTV